MAQGLIAAALGGFGKALSTIGEMEAKKQNEAKLRKELMDMESEERLRLDEIMYERKLERMPKEAIVQAESTAGAEAAGYKKRADLGVPALAAGYTVATESAKLDAEEEVKLSERRAKAKVGGEKAEILAASEANLPEERAKFKSRETKAQLDSDMKLGIPEAQAAYKVLQRIEELKAADLKNLSGEEAKAKYAALKADIDEAKRTKYWDSYYEQEADKLLKSIKAQIDAKVPEAKAELTATERKTAADALVKTGTLKSEAVAGAEKRLEDARALIEKNVAEEEAKLFARQEVAKIQAMTAQGVPEAEAKLLAAKWKAQKTQRDEAAAEKTQQEMQDLITKMKNKDYTKALKTKETIDATSGLILQANRDAKEQKDRERNSITMERQIKATQAQIADALGVEPKKVNEEKAYLEDLAAKGDATAKTKLARIKPLVEDLDSLRKELRSLQRGNPSSSSSSGAETYKVGEERTLSDGANKGKTVVWDGTRWNLKK